MKTNLKAEMKLKHEFVENIPDRIQEGIIYISIPFAITAHRCCCGCGSEVFNHLSPTDWRLIFDGRSVSLDPSIGNWSFACRSHYWIRHNRVKWAAAWNQEIVSAGRADDQRNKANFYKSDKTPHSEKTNGISAVDWLSLIYNSVRRKPKR